MQGGCTYRTLSTDSASVQSTNPGRKQKISLIFRILELPQEMCMNQMTKTTLLFKWPLLKWRLHLVKADASTHQVRC